MKSSLLALILLAGPTARAADVSPTPKPPAASAAASPKPVASAPDDATLRRAKGSAEDLKDEADYRIGRARRIFDRDHLADAQRPEVARALDRAIEHLQVQVGRVSKTVAAMKTADPDQLKPGPYTFYCSVDAHRQAGMVGTLKVS